ncbi:MAG: ribbon-helix-helix protein, CopG family [Acidimicrobiales bacterium]
MRTTVVLDDDVAAAVEQLRRERSLGMSEAVNELVRAGLLAKPARRRFRQRSQRMGAKIDLSNIGEVLELIEGPSHR